MKKGLFFAIILSLLFLVGCSTNETNNTENRIESQSMYIDDDIVFTIDDSTISLDSFNYNNLGDNIDLSATIKIKNNTLESKKYTIKNVKLIKEDTGVNYKVYYTNNLTLNAELTGSINFNSTIPSYTVIDRYYLAFLINSKKIVINLYNRPDELKSKWNVDYYVEGKWVHNSTVIDGKCDAQYIYETKDHFYYCNIWYREKELIYKFHNSNPITKDTELYGELYETLQYTTTSTDKYSFVTRVNYMHPDGKIYVPRSHNNKEIAIGAYAFSANLQATIGLLEIYVPINVRQLYGSSFGNIPENVKIYYEGTEEQWKSLFYTGGVYTKNVIYNSRMPY